MNFVLAALGVAVKWLLAGLLGRLLFSVVSQGVILAATLYWSGDIADWATGKLVSFVKNSQFADRLSLAFGSIGSLPENVVQLWGCLGAYDVFVVLLSGQIAGIGVALIARKLL
jgi:hypothetical protein